MVADVSGLVDSERGLISRRIFFERETYEQELERFASPACAASRPPGQLAAVHRHLPGGGVSRRLPLNTQMGLGHEGFSEELMGWAGKTRFSE